MSVFLVCIVSDVIHIWMPRFVCRVVCIRNDALLNILLTSIWNPAFGTVCMAGRPLGRGHAPVYVCMNIPIWVLNARWH